MTATKKVIKIGYSHMTCFTMVLMVISQGLSVITKGEVQIAGEGGWMEWQESLFWQPLFVPGLDLLSQLQQKRGNTIIAYQAFFLPEGNSSFQPSGEETAYSGACHWASVWEAWLERKLIPKIPLQLLLWRNKGLTPGIIAALTYLIWAARGIAVQPIRRM